MGVMFYSRPTVVSCGLLCVSLLQLAGRRKSMLDEMAIKEQESASVQQKRAGELEYKFKVSTVPGLWNLLSWTTTNIQYSEHRDALCNQATFYGHLVSRVLRGDH